MEIVNPSKIRDLFKARKEKPFYPELDLHSIESDFILGVSGKLTSIYRLEMDDLSLKEEEELDSFIRLIERTLNTMGEGVSLELRITQEMKDYDFIKRSKLMGDKEDGLSRYLRNEALYWAGYSFHKKRNVYLSIVTQGVSGLRSVKPLYQFWKSSNSSFKEASKKEWEKAMGEADQTAERIVSSLLSASIKAKRLLGDEILVLLYEYLNPNRRKTLPISDLLRESTIRSQIVLSPPRVEYDHFFMDDYYFQGINLIRIPNPVILKKTLEFLSKLNFTYDLLLSIESPDQEAEEARVQLKGNLSKAFSILKSSTDYDAERKIAESDALLTEIKATDQKLFYFSLSLTVRAKEKEALEKKATEVLQGLRNLGNAEPILDHMEHDRIFISHLPGHGGKNPRRHLIQTNALARLLPLSSPWKGSDEPVVPLKTSEGFLMGFDPLDMRLPAKHGLILGSTGSGKSFLTNHILTQFLSYDPKNEVVIIDVGGSYKKLARIFNGNYFEIELNKDYSLNPFPARSAMLYGERLDHDLVGYLAMLLEKMLKLEKPSPEESFILETAVKHSYRNLALNVSPTLKQVENILRNFEDKDPIRRSKALAFARNLERWTEGRYGELFNKSKGLEVNKRLSVFDLARLTEEKDLQGVLFFMIRALIADKLKDPKKKKLIVIDEGWRFFQDEIGSRLIGEWYRTARKYNAAIYSISQSPEDFLSSLGSGAILANTYVRFILKLTKGHERLKELDLAPREIEAIKNLSVIKGRYSEFLLKFLDQKTLGRLEPSLLGYWLYTTDPQDRVLEEKARAENKFSDELSLLKHMAKTFKRNSYEA